MILFEKAMTICTDKEYAIDIQTFIDQHIKTVGVHHIYVADDKVYAGFNTKLSVTDVAKIVLKKLYKSETNIVGGTIFVDFGERS